MLIIVLFVLFIVQGLWIAYRAENLYCTMVGIGIMAQIVWQVFCNIAVVTNTLPNTGKMCIRDRTIRPFWPLLWPATSSARWPPIWASPPTARRCV